MIAEIRAVLFDLDGTLVDTAGEIASALALALRDVGAKPITPAETRDMIGRGVTVLVQRALAKTGGDAALLDRAVLRFEYHYERVLGTESSVFAGVLPGLELLHAHAIPMGVVTNKPRHFTERLLQSLGLDVYFLAVVAGDDGHLRKPAGDMLLAACARLSGEPRATLMIGDSANDVLAARAAGCPAWCVPYGYNEGRAVETLQCDRIVATIEEAARLIAR